MIPIPAKRASSGRPRKDAALTEAQLERARGMASRGIEPSIIAIWIGAEAHVVAAALEKANEPV